MLRSYFTLTLRSLWRNRIYTLLNISGIAIGLAAVTLVYWQVMQIRNYDTQHPHADRLYRVGEHLPTEPPTNLNSVVPLLPALMAENPAVEAGTRLFGWQRNWLSYQGREDQRRIFHADTSLFSVLNFPLKLGDPKTALATPNAMVIADKVADQLFPTENPMNKTVVLDNGRAYVIRGVLAARPVNSTIEAEVILPISDLAGQADALTNWYNGNCQTYLRLRPGIEPAQFERSLGVFVKAHYVGEAKDRQINLLPVKELLENQTRGQLPVILFGLLLIAGFILLVVAINFLNLTTAISLARSGEVALRTTLGAAAGQVVRQFISESVLVAGLGAVLGTVLLKALLPVYIDFFDIADAFSPQLPPTTVLFLAGVVLLLGAVAGWLPSRYLLRQPVVASLQGKTTTRRSPFRSGLVVVQFALTTVLITCTGVMISQNRYVRNHQMGFAKDNLVAVELDRSYRNPALAEAAVDNLIRRLQQTNNVLGVSTTRGVPGLDLWYDENTYTNVLNNKEALFRFQPVDDTFLSTFGIALVAGRSLTAADTAVGNGLPNGTAVIINETGARAVGYPAVGEAIGKVVRTHGTGGATLTIAGVFHDYYERGAHRGIQPSMFWASGPARLRDNHWLSIRTKPGAAPALLADLGKQFAAIPARKPFRYVYLSDEYNKAYWLLDKSQSFLTAMSLVTVLLACAGIYGLSLFSIRQRMKEIGIRKVLGASAFRVVVLLSQQTVRLVGIGVIAALPMAWFMMTRWLATFAMHIAFPWWIATVSGILALLVALLTVSTQSIRAVLANPIESLRSE